jgi:AcrR family transcriptional regulator
MKQLRINEANVTQRLSSELESVGFNTVAGGSKKSRKVALKRQPRALATRGHLTEAARKVFARDGFEQARIEDIAALAGKTRGAFYANFKDKEDVFYAIFEEYIERDRTALRPMLAERTTLRERWEAVAEYLGSLVQDRQRTLLMLEFKLYAIRHPRRRKRLAQLHAEMRERCAMPEFEELVPERERQTTEQRRRGILGLSAVMDGLALNRLFNPEELQAELIGQYLTVCVDEAFQRRGQDQQRQSPGQESRTGRIGRGD